MRKSTTDHIDALDHLPEANVVVFDNTSAAVLEVAQGRADAMTIYRNAEIHDTTHAVSTPFQEDYECWGMALCQEYTDALGEGTRSALQTTRARVGCML